MDNLVPIEPPKLHEEPGSDVKRFLATRGMLIMKEFRDVNVVRCDYGSRIKISTAIISSMQRATAPSRTTYGIRIEAADDEREIGTAFLDFDEFQEVISALEYINTMAREMELQQRDYTEVNYITKDDIKFGFYQLEGRQVAFVGLDNYSESIFLTLPMLDFVRKNIEFSRDYLKSRGARE